MASVANGINDLSVIVGSGADANDVDHAVSWDRAGTLSQLPELPGGSNSEALAISDTGFIVGDTINAAGNGTAVLWH